jgi:hypothetical protein
LKVGQAQGEITLASQEELLCEYLL